MSPHSVSDNKRTAWIARCKQIVKHDWMLHGIRFALHHWDILWQRFGVVGKSPEDALAEMVGGAFNRD